MPWQVARHCVPLTKMLHSTLFLAWSADMHLKTSIRPATNMAQGHRWMKSLLMAPPMTCGDRHLGGVTHLSWVNV